MLRFISKILFLISESTYRLPATSDSQSALMDKLDSIVGKNTLIHMSYKQYLAHKSLDQSRKFLIFNTLSFIVTLPIVLLLFFRVFFISRKTQQNISLTKTYIPDCLEKKYLARYNTQPLGFIDIQIFNNYFLKPLIISKSPYFSLRLLWKVAVYNQIIFEYNPVVILTSSEMNFESSALTKFCNHKMVLHINVMHGEKFNDLNDSFCSFNEFYVWKKHHIEVFSFLRAKIDKFVVFDQFVGKDFQINNESNLFKYYFQINNDFNIFKKRISNIIVFCQKNSLIPVLRFHPLHITEEEVKYVNSMDIAIESNKIDLLHSISEAKYVCSEFSSVLTQALDVGVQIVVDNTVNENIQRLKDIRFYPLTKEYKLLV